MTTPVQNKLDKLPRSPGSYQMKNDNDVVLYVGKATDLRSRVRQYFQGTDPRPFVRLLDRVLADIDFVVTQNAKEALVLENTLIKRYRPRFNFMLRDDKNYLSLRVDTRQPWPRVEIVRQQRDDGAHYFGPYHDASAARMMVNIIHRHFQIRNCSDSMFRSRVRPCLQYQIKRCPAPCVLPVDPEEYRESVDQMLLFLAGRNPELIAHLKDRMEQAATRLDFERAAQYRDQIHAIENSLVPQSAQLRHHTDTDVVALYREGEAGQIVLASFEKGEMSQFKTWPVRKQLIDSPALLSQFITQYYDDAITHPAKEILVSEAIDDIDSLENLLTEKRGERVYIHYPKRGEKKRLLDLALLNAKEHFDQADDQEARLDDALETMQKRFRLQQEPRTIECFDISNFQGEEIVASQVCFVDGMPDRSRYARYIIRSVEQQDDFASMFEVIARRTKQHIQGKRPLPDLMVIDGGRGQLNAARHALQSYDIKNQDIISLAESRTIGTDETGATTHSAERVFLPNVRDPITLPQSSDVVLLLTRIRNEAHRFAITFNRQRLKKSRLRSELDEISGIGPKRRNALIQHFGSVKKVKEATLQELANAPSISEQLAWSIFDHFHPGEADRPTEDA